MKSIKLAKYSVFSILYKKHEPQLLLSSGSHKDSSAKALDMFYLFVK